MGTRVRIENAILHIANGGLHMHIRREEGTTVGGRRQELPKRRISLHEPGVKSASVRKMRSNGKEEVHGKTARVVRASQCRAWEGWNGVSEQEDKTEKARRSARRRD